MTTPPPRQSDRSIPVQKTAVSEDRQHGRHDHRQREVGACEHRVREGDRRCRQQRPDGREGLRKVVLHRNNAVRRGEPDHCLRLDERPRPIRGRVLASHGGRRADPIAGARQLRCVAVIIVAGSPAVGIGRDAPTAARRQAAIHPIVVLPNGSVGDVTVVESLGSSSPGPGSASRSRCP